MSLAPQRSPLRLDALEAVAVLAAGAIVAYQLFAPPSVGLADEGDFWKVMGPAGLQYRKADWGHRAYAYVNFRYEIVPRLPSGYKTSEAPLAAVARFAEVRLRRDGLFDLRALGLLHAAIFLAGFALLLLGTRPLSFAARLVFAAAVLCFFTDVGYVATLNSFYSGTASLLFLFVAAGAAACLASGRSGPLQWIAYGIGALGFVTSKPQEFAHAPVLGALAVLLARERRTIRVDRAGALAGALCVAAVVYYATIPAYLKSEALYNDLFFQLLYQSPTPEADLRELDLPPEWIAYRGTHAYVANCPLSAKSGFRGELLRRFGFRRIVRYYARHPDRALGMLAKASGRAFALRPHYLGNFAIEAGEPPKAQSRAFGVWSATKKRLSPAGPWLLPVFWLANVSGAVAVLRRSTEATARGYAIALLALVAMALVEFATCTFGDALADVARHLHSFNAMTDLLLAADLAWVAAVVSRAGERRVKFRSDAPSPRLSPAAGGEEKLRRGVRRYGRLNVRTRNAAISPRVFARVGQ